MKPTLFRKKQAPYLSVLLLISLTSTALCQSVDLVGDGFYLDYDVLIPSLHAPVGELASFDIVAHKSAAILGATGVTLRIIELPAGWIAIATPNPAAATVIGDPLTTGATVLFGSCQMHDTNTVHLYSIALVPISEASQHMIRVVGLSGEMQSNPRMTLCDDPVFTTLESRGGTLMLNPPLAVSEASWSAIKLLYGGER